MKRQLFAMLVREHDEVSLAALGRAIAYAPRSERVRVWRSFVRSGGDQVLRVERTQRLRRVSG